MQQTLSEKAGDRLAEVLARIARERGLAVERLLSAETIAAAREGWPGASHERWDKWLAEAGASLGLRCRPAVLSPAEAVLLAGDGAIVVHCRPASDLEAGASDGLGAAVEGHAAGIGESDSPDPGDWSASVDPVFLLGADRGRVQVATLGSPRPRWTTHSELRDALGGDGPLRWLVVPPREQFGVVAARRGPVERLWAIWSPERSDVLTVVVFAFFAGMLSLATPIAVEALVNTVAFGRAYQPVLWLSILLFGFLAFAASMRALQTLVVEIVQRRLFARVAADLSHRLPRATGPALDGAYGPELVNRFFDVVTLQKVTASLLLDGVGVVLTTVIGMVILAFYHPWLLGFDLILLASVVAGLAVLGRGAFQSAIEESKYKYKLASWLEDIARCPVGFRLSGGAVFASDRANSLTSAYLQKRRKHFGRLFRQLLFIYLLQAVAGTALLGFGGLLVIKGQLTLGQLVAAELIVAMILGSMAKIAKHLESFYDVVASVDKLGVLFDLEEERRDGSLHLAEGRGPELRLLGVAVRGGGERLASGLDLEVAPGERVALYGGGGVGKTALMETLFGLRPPRRGRVEVAGCDPRDLRPDILRKRVALAADAELFEGTIAENVSLRRPDVTAAAVRDALQAVGLLDAVLDLAEGLDTPLASAGAPLSAAHRRLVTLARALAGKPRLLLVDGLLDGLPDDELRTVLAFLAEPGGEMSVVVATGRRSIANRFERVVALADDAGDSF